MTYAVLHIDHESGLKERRRLRAEHLEHVLRNRAVYVAGGPILADSTDQPIGGIMLLDLPTRAAVQAFLAEDPYFREGVHERVEIWKWRQVLPEPRPGFLEDELDAETRA